MTDLLRDRIQETYACALRAQDATGPGADCTQNLKDALLAVLDVCDDSDAYPPESPMGSGYAIACRSVRYRIQRTLDDDEFPRSVFPATPGAANVALDDEEPTLDVDGYPL